MESLLSLSFDNISSRNTNKTRKGLRQIEGLLVQICLSPSTSHTTNQSKRNSSSINHATATSTQLDVLAQDLAFQEFFRLQESFQWNVATRLTECLERLLGLRSTPQTDELIHSTLNLLQGTLLLHPPSRTLFSRETHMNLLLDLLDPIHTRPQTLCAALQVLTIALLDRPSNARLFETLDGINTVASLWKEQQNPQQKTYMTNANDKAEDVQAQCREFLLFYLMPETPTASAGSSVTDMPPPPPPNFISSSSSSAASPHHRRTPSKLSGVSSESPSTSTVNSNNSNGSGVSLWSAGSGSDAATATRSAAEKRRLLNAYLDKGAASALSGDLLVTAN